MHIAIMTDLYLPMSGGTEVSIENQRKALESAGHSVTIFTAQHKGIVPPAHVVFIPSVNFTTGQQETMRISRPFVTSFIVDELTIRKVDIVHVQTDFAVGIAGVYAAKKLKLPLVYTFHTLLWKQLQTRTTGEKLAVHIFEKPMQWRLDPPKGFKLARLPGEPLYAFKARRHVCMLASQADLVISPSVHMAHKFHDWLPHSRIVVSQNFITTPIRKQSLPTTPTFLWMGRMMPEKRVMDFCHAIDLMSRSTDQPFCVTIIGNGYHFEDVSRWAKDKPFVTLLGSVPNEEVHDYIDRSSALVMTSQGFDNQPMVIAETIVAGRGVVSVDPELLLDVDPGAGMYPIDSSPEGLAQRLIYRVEHPEKLQHMSDAAHNSAHVFSDRAGRERLIAAYHTALTASK